MEEGEEVVLSNIPQSQSGYSPSGFARIFSFPRMYPNPRRIVPAFVPDLRFWKGSSVPGMGIEGGLKGVDTISVELLMLV